MAFATVRVALSEVVLLLTTSEISISDLPSFSTMAFWVILFSRRALGFKERQNTHFEKKIRITSSFLSDVLNLKKMAHRLA